MYSWWALLVSLQMAEEAEPGATFWSSMDMGEWWWIMVVGHSWWQASPLVVAAYPLLHGTDHF